MTKAKEYGGLDYFRFIAAAMVVAIHTSPLMNINERADFILCRILCRIAVPFFFMVTGYFIYSDNNRMKDKVNHFARKTAVLYAIAMFLYLPINLYNGYFNEQQIFVKILKDLLFDGTLYHLWYLPAAIIGVYLTLLLFSKCNNFIALSISFILYLFGLFGDSYYGIAAKIGPMKELYDIIFEVSDYTRNGFFYAPIFLLLGGLISRYKKLYSIYTLILGLAFSVCLMIAEGIALYTFKLQRHDSMYLMLLPCMIYLFQILLHVNKRAKPVLRSISMIIYIIHPLVIVCLRGLAKFLHLEGLLLDNSIAYYLAVFIISLVVAVLYVKLPGLLTQKRSHLNKTPRNKMSRAWLQIDLSALEHNVEVLKNSLPNGSDIMAIVKANAYGHGDYIIASHLNKLGIKAFGVATIDEGISLRKHGIKGDILILGYTDPTRINEVQHYRLIQTVIDYDYAKALCLFKKPVKVHLKIDTGMHRIGLDVREIDKIEELFSYPKLDIQGVFTHLCVADSLSSDDTKYTINQISTFYNLIELLKEKGIVIPKIHFQSSYGMLNYSDIHGDYVRLGIALYGSLSSPMDRTRKEIDLQPVLSLKARIAMLHKVSQGDQVGYGRNFIAKRDSLLAVLPIGYADGLPRNLSCENGGVLIHGHYAPIVGRICMDQLLVDVTDIADVKPGDIATLIGKDGDSQISAEDVAYHSGTITNELLSRLGPRLERVYGFGF